MRRTRIGPFGRALVAASNRVARMFGWLEDFFAERRRRWFRCSNCGRSRFYGEDCSDTYAILGALDDDE